MTIKLTPAGADLMAMNLRDRIDAAVEGAGTMTRAELTAKVLDASDKAFGDTVRDSISILHDEPARRVTISIPAFAVYPGEDDRQ
jgi:hypothetical protein